MRNELEITKEITASEGEGLVLDLNSLLNDCECSNPKS